eukprot:TRINITY_DN2937_c0_g1_i6.p1 TRINITY_DN2937_c0_g1~~TRINITY_DN2937_c0_g1_i6.p1  ORF type:complete len:637 (+),score=123.14 TRINITY_DN2937_c0_g1_i6:386-2296(+)
MMLTLADSGSSSLQIHGPSGIESFVDAIKLTASIRKTMAVSVLGYAEESHPFVDENINLDCITISACDHTIVKDQDGPSPKRFHLASDSLASKTCHLVIKLKDTPGKFDPKRAIELGVAKGPLFGDLKAGKSVVNKEGKVIMPHECVDPSTPGPMIILVDVPDLELLDATLQSSKLKEACNSPHLVAVVHNVHTHVLESKQYKDWLESFAEKVQHIVANPDCCSHRLVFTSAATFVKKLNYIDDDLFPSLYSSDAPLELSSLELPSQCMAAKSLMKIVLHPPTQIGMDLSQIVTEPSADEIRTEIDSLSQADFPAKLSEYKARSREREIEVKKSFPDDFTLLFLGTGSAIPSKYRNVTGMYLKYASGFSILLDGGEGSFGQLFRHFGPKLLDEMLINLSAAFISHIHADHHIGLVRILAYRLQIGKQSGTPLQPLIVIGSYQLQQWLSRVQGLFGDLHYQFVDSTDLMAGKHSWIEEISSATKIQGIRTIPVPHCRGSCAIRIDHRESKGILYSGDTRFSESLIQAGQGIGILVHEATFEDELEQEADKKHHSTVSQAIEVGNRMGADHTILTHFSQRYPKLPVISQANSANQIGIAFDFMKITPETIGRLPSTFPCIQILLADGEASDSDSIRGE